MHMHTVFEPICSCFYWQECVRYGRCSKQ